MDISTIVMMIATLFIGISSFVIGYRISNYKSEDAMLSKQQEQMSELSKSVQFHYNRGWNACNDWWNNKLNRVSVKQDEPKYKMTNHKKTNLRLVVNNKEIVK